MLTSLKHRIDRLHALYRLLYASAEHSLVLQRRREIERLRASSRYQHEDRLVRFGYKIYSQNDEDGILAEIFRRMEIASGYFIEVGVGDGTENNTLALILQGWKGLWIEGSAESFHSIRAGLRQTIEERQLTLLHAFVTQHNINSLLTGANVPSEPDLLSIDIDGNDLHIWQAITCVRPRVVVAEYNPKFPPPVSYCMQYNERHIWDGSDNYGASLSCLTEHYSEAGYALVGCNLTGTNAFFVRSDLLQGRFSGPFTAEYHYEPARYELVSAPSGHPAGFATIENRLRTFPPQRQG